jgi:hypothetical protein
VFRLPINSQGHAAGTFLEETMITPMSVGCFVEALDEGALP